MQGQIWDKFWADEKVKEMWTTLWSEADIIIKYSMMGRICSESTNFNPTQPHNL